MKIIQSSHTFKPWSPRPLNHYFSLEMNFSKTFKKKFFKRKNKWTNTKNRNNSRQKIWTYWVGLDAKIRKLDQNASLNIIITVQLWCARSCYRKLDQKSSLKLVWPWLWHCLGVTVTQGIWNIGLLSHSDDMVTFLDMSQINCQ